jgi:hypothetical protein
MRNLFKAPRIHYADAESQLQIGKFSVLYYPKSSLIWSSLNIFWIEGLLIYEASH